MPKESASKRQKVAQQEFEHLDELGVDAFSVFLQDHSKYIPYRVLYQTIARNKNLIQWFKQFATDNWWRKRTKNDFYDFYDAIINPDKKTFNQHTQNWLKQTIDIHENLWSMPWKIVYMVCYGMVTLISTTNVELNHDDFVKMDINFPSVHHLEDFSGDLMIQPSDYNAPIFSWITGKKLTTIDTTHLYAIKPIRNGFLFIGNRMDLIYKRENDTPTVREKGDVEFTETRSTSNIIVQRKHERSIVTHRNGTGEKTLLESKVFPLSLDKYLFAKIIYQWPDTFVTRIPLLITDALFATFGPFNFTNNTFVFFVRTPTNDFYLVNSEKKRHFFDYYLSWESFSFKYFSYGFVIQSYREKRDKICMPSGHTMIINHHYYDSQISSICGPFMCIRFGQFVGYQVVDFWSTLQKKREEPIQFISSQNCHNCGLVASLQCTSCESAFCGASCVQEHTQISECKHGSL